MSLYRPAAATSLSSSSYRQAVSRSAELLSCAKTAVKVAQKSLSSGQESARWAESYNVSHMQLFEPGVPPETNPLLEDGLSLLRTMESELKQLEALVRRRGHTNDPTHEISQSVQRLKADTNELMQLIQNMVPSTLRNGQRKKHCEMIQSWFQSILQKEQVQ